MNAKLLALMTILCLTGCKMTDNLDEMHSSTMDMSSTTKQMKDTTLKMERGTQAMYHQMRSKEAQETRTRSLRGLLESQTFEEKLTHAVPYYQGFEFQLWTGGKTDIDTMHFREELLAIGVDEFFRALQSLMTGLNARELSPSTDDNNALSAFALAVTLHEAHVSQKTLMDSKYQERDFLGMIKEALKLEPLIENGELSTGELTEWQENILFQPWKETAVDLLYMRHQMLVAMALSRISDVKERGLIGRALMMVRSWDSEFLELNLVTQTDVNDYLEESLSTKTFLESMGYRVELNPQIKNILRKMNQRSCGDDCAQDEKKNLEQFKKQVSELI